MSSVASMAGPDLPVRFSTWSIASNRDSKDPFSQGESAGGTSGEGLSDAQCTLTSASFRQRMDSARSFTASAPPGARPPSARRPPCVTSVYGDVDVDRDETDDRPRRDAASPPSPPHRSLRLPRALWVQGGCRVAGARGLHI